ncbi:hypothetical protein GCM10010517_17740 [Streptosporangium fragile]|uniref:Carboxyltransferase domain-containing protein n=1 Tax=Streptosporangium fragile TaxID=46186 RepID=A0ABN3VV33_9ACTN
MTGDDIGTATHGPLRENAAGGPENPPRGPGPAGEGSARAGKHAGPGGDPARAGEHGVPGEGSAAVRRAGEHGLLVETGSLEVSHRLDALLRSDRPAGVVEIVPGPATVLVTAPDTEMSRLRALLSRLLDAARDGGPGGGTTARTVTVPVIYDGADLHDVAALCGLSAGEVVARHTRRELVVGWLGFAPGFAYLTGLDPVLHVPRLDTPRTAVPAGAVAVAGPYSAIYPSASPGGWRLLGRSPMTVWDAAADPPALLTPGTRVRFQEVSGP